MTAHILDRIFERCEEVPGKLATTCIVYTGRDGSGLVWDYETHRNVPAPRILWEALHGPLYTQRLQHICGLSGCVRPGHMKLAG